MSYEAFKQAEIEGWDQRADVYDDVTGRLTTQAAPLLLHLIGAAPEKRILDLCCGTGRAVGAALALGAGAEGLDASPRMIAAARRRFPQSAFEVADAEAIPRPDGAYDGVLCAFGLMHVGAPQTMFEEMARVLKPGGRAALSHWVGPPHSPFFRVVFGTMQRLADMSAAPAAPPPFALSSEDALQSALGAASFENVEFARLPLIFTAPAGQFAPRLRAFAVRAGMILDQQTEAVRQQIFAEWDAQLDEFRVDDEYRIPMPAFTASAAKPR